MNYHEAYTAIRDAALVKLTAALPEIFYLVVGANDGMRGDPLSAYTANPKWRGILFEPLPGPFGELQRNYAARPSAELRNEAIVADAPGGRRTFYNVPSSTVHSSFNMGTIAKHAPFLGARNSEDLAKLIEPIEVKCRAVTELSELAGFRVPDVLLTDTEGYDFELFKAWWPMGWRPPFVEVEVIHLSEADRKTLFDTLAAGGYDTFFYYTDAIALRRDAFAAEDLRIFQLLSAQTLAILALMEMATGKKTALPPPP